MLVALVALVTYNRYDLTGLPNCVWNATADENYLVFSYRKWNCRYLHKTKTTGWKISTLKHVLRRHTLGESIQKRKKLLEKETGFNNENEYYINRCLMQRWIKSQKFEIVWQWLEEFWNSLVGWIRQTVSCFYRTRVRSLFTLVTNSLTDWLTDTLTILIAVATPVPTSQHKQTNK